MELFWIIVGAILFVIVGIPLILWVFYDLAINVIPFTFKSFFKAILSGIKHLAGLKIINKMADSVNKINKPY